MKYIQLISVLLLLASCDGMGSHTNKVIDSSASVQLIPSDSPNQAMPVQPTDTSATANMPRVDPDTSKIQPK